MLFREVKENQWKINEIRFQMAVSLVIFTYAEAALLYCIKRHWTILYYQKILLQSDVYVFAFN